MRVVFAGTPEFSLSTLDVLLAHPTIELVAVYTQPDRRSGRGKMVQASPVKQCATENNIPVIQPESFKDLNDIDSLASLKPDLMVVTAYGLILPPAILAIPRLGCINVHASLLPRWRGAAPIQRAIEAGDKTTGITLMQMEVGLDSGPMLGNAEIPIAENDTGGSLHDKLMVLGGKLLLESLDDILEKKLTPIQQDKAEVTYANKLIKGEAKIDWQQPAVQIAQKIRAFNPWPIAVTQLDDQILRILHATPSKYSIVGHSAGEIVALDKSTIHVATEQGSLAISEIQKPGGKPMSAKDFLNGTPLQNGMSFQ